MNAKRIGLAAAISAIGLGGFVSSISASQPESTTLTLQQAPPHLANIDLPAEEEEMGDLMLFDATFASEDGSKSGVLNGSLIVVDMPDTNTENAPMLQSRLTNLVFVFDNQDPIVINGSAVYPADSAAEMVANTPQVRAIVGGTGEFIGASGELSSTRNEDGTYTHVLTLLND
ncbi:MAG: hypothetical protein ACR2J8_03000 [Thermomicrobiales bacterium]